MELFPKGKSLSDPHGVTKLGSSVKSDATTCYILEELCFLIIGFGPDSDYLPAPYHFGYGEGLRAGVLLPGAIYCLIANDNHSPFSLGK